MNRTPWDIWMESLTSSSDAYTQATQHWQRTVSGFWQVPAAYWQTVSSICDARARTWQSIMADAPSQFKAIATCTTWPDMVEQGQKAYGKNMVALYNLAGTVQSHRMYLWNTLQANTQTMLPPMLQASSTTALANGWLQSMQNIQQTSTAFIPFQAKSLTLPTTPTAWMAAGWDFQTNLMRQFFQAWQFTGSPMVPTPAATPVAPKASTPKEPKASPAPKSESKATSSESDSAPSTPAPRSVEATVSLPKESQTAAPAKVEKAASADVASSSPQLALLTPPTAEALHSTPGLNGTPHHSSTASNGVVRSSGGIVATAAAAAARRSVVARRASRSRPRVVRPR